ncbi:MAG: MerR family transcriptional regulator [Phenylobacterium sp.]|uniref:MerR family transcriptional regulator n=1 Tax=Phenylobacterium sp. TaxID=1871053 RepID=UPI0025F29721|nr:MerR family transcriptional regulator [Phenylobacterium sp.]MCA6223672.1 MerR family transcriptional regulator [Phenylobacterium sp.]MCA6226513.1 MerR family transcriptional regulator [Phenylobacterium sp.]MCA6233087.1 MerR family transcriptional regulator [Phenylobacterium sp.]MCA6234844.1 MerR family transcriptional regulator [Phenylobacterium sp.]MCA6247981.1 MerR family transcriptional regulator [Phenylobacterium sp.]
MAKGPEAFRTISEAAEEVGVAPHVLRFWETRFSVIRPMKRAGGRRFYRPQDVALLRTLRVLLHDQGRSIKDVQRLSRSEGVRALNDLATASVPVYGVESVSGDLAARPAVEPRDRPDEAGRRRLAAARDDLLAIKRRLDALLSG